MKEKLESLESEGINPTRDHVMNHLDAIKDLTFGNLNVRLFYKSHFLK